MAAAALAQIFVAVLRVSVVIIVKLATAKGRLVNENVNTAIVYRIRLVSVKKASMVVFATDVSVSYYKSVVFRLHFL